MLFSCGGGDAEKSDVKKEGLDDESSKLGLINHDLMDDEADLLTDMPTYSSAAPGTSTKVDRAFENAPPMVPHSTEGLLPITKDRHMCITCHMPENAEKVKATPIPISHLTDYRPAVSVATMSTIKPNAVVMKDLGGKLDMSRYVCTSCHVPQANVEPMVQNNFEAAYRRKEAKNKSNLNENIAEGVK